MKIRTALAVSLLAFTSVGVGFTATSASAQTPPPYCATKTQLAIVGTSAETGYATTGYPSGAQTYNPTTYGWATRFANSVHSQWSTNVSNYAHNGSLASDFLPGGRFTDTTAAVADIAVKKPTLVLLDVGGNEYWSQKDPAVFQTNLNTLIDNIKAATPNAVILMSIYAELKWVQSVDSGNVPQKYTWAQYASVIYNTAVAKGNALVDLRQYIPPATATPQPNPSTWYTDGIHQNDAGNIAEYGMWWSWVSALWSNC